MRNNEQIKKSNPFFTPTRNTRTWNLPFALLLLHQFVLRHFFSIGTILPKQEKKKKSENAKADGRVQEWSFSLSLSLSHTHTAAAFLVRPSSCRSLGKRQFSSWAAEHAKCTKKKEELFSRSKFGALGHQENLSCKKGDKKCLLLYCQWRWLKSAKRR